MKESDLFEPVKELLEREMFCEVHGEVLNLDVVGIGKGYNIIVELKTSMSLQLLDQITERCGKADYVFVAVPTRKSRMSLSAQRYLKSIKVGIIEVFLEGDTDARVIQWGGRQTTKFDLNSRVNDRTRRSVGGVSSSEMDTVYKETMYKVKRFLKWGLRGKLSDGWVTVDEMLENIETHYSNPKPSIMATLQESWNEDWIETKVENRIRYFRLKEGVKVPKFRADN